MSQEEIERVTLPHPKQKGKFIEEYILIYKEEGADNGYDDLGYRALLQSGDDTPPGELLFCGSQILAEIMACQTNMPMVEGLGQELIKAIENFAELLAKFEKIEDMKKEQKDG